MKKLVLAFLILFISPGVFSQNANADKEKKENMGQSISEVNDYYREKMKDLRSDESLSKEERRQRKRDLKQMKRDRIHEINSGGVKRQNKDRDKGKNEKEKVKEAKGPKDKAKMKDKKEKQKGKKN